MFGKLADELGSKWLRLLLVVGLAGMVALSGCTFRGEAEGDEDDDNDVNVDGDNNDGEGSGEVRGEGSPGLAWIAALGALGGVAYAARRRLQ